MKSSDSQKFELLRVLADRSPESPPAKFLILGSASPSLIKEASESLAGRIEFIDLGGFDMREVGSNNQNRLWMRGGFPRSYLANTDEDSIVWRESFIRTFLERDIPQLGIQIPSSAMRRFWTMLAHYHGQTWNASELARSMGLSQKTVSRYLDILNGTYMVRTLQPWYENLRKRQVKSPKIYIRDSGIFHALLTIPDLHSLQGHPKLGTSWEGFMLEQVIRRFKPSDVYFWGSHNGAELDLLMPLKGKRYGFEFKWKDAPRMTKSMAVALNDLSLEYLWVIYSGRDSYKIHEKVSAVPAQSLFVSEFLR